MTGSAWFSLSVGRNKRAEPRWILPLICKAGDITRDDVGSIKIFDDETRFEITAEKSAEFAARIASKGSFERGVTISPADGQPREAKPDAAAPRKAWQTPRPAADEGTVGEPVPDNRDARTGKPGKPANRRGRRAASARMAPRASPNRAGRRASSRSSQDQGPGGLQAQDQGAGLAAAASVGARQ